MSQGRGGGGGDQVMSPRHEGRFPDAVVALPSHPPQRGQPDSAVLQLNHAENPPRLGSRAGSPWDTQ